MIIDAHIHYTPPEMKDNLKEFAENDPYWGLLITPDPIKPTEQGWASVGRMIDDMDRAGIDKVILLSLYRKNAEGCRDANNETIDIVKKYPDRVSGFCVFDPSDPEEAIDEVTRCVDEGLIGVGEMNPYALGLRPDHPGFLKVVEAIIDLEIPMNLHVSEEVGHYYLGKSATPMLQYYELAVRFPELKLILAHWGGGLLFFEIMPEVKRDLQNVYYDMAASPLLYPTDAIFKLALNSTDHRKLLFGSDYPLIILPKKQNGVSFIPFMDEIRNLNLDKNIFDDIMGNNMARLLGWLPADGYSKKSNLKPASKFITEIKDSSIEITENMSVAAVARMWPETRAVFDQYGINWVDVTVPYWEPIIQAAATRGLGPEKRKKLLLELQEIKEK